MEKHLESEGEKIVSDWIHIYDLIPYSENLERSKETAEKVVHAVNSADIFVLISDKEGTYVFVELGVALAKYEQAPNTIRIYIVGEHSKRSLMQLHPAIVHLSIMNEVMEKEGLSLGFEIPKCE